jgi:hypothetical protein
MSKDDGTTQVKCQACGYVTRVSPGGKLTSPHCAACGVEVPGLRKHYKPKAKAKGGEKS